MEAGGSEEASTPIPRAATVRGPLIGPQSAASAPKAFPSGVPAATPSSTPRRLSGTTQSSVNAASAPARASAARPAPTHARANNEGSPRHQNHQRRQRWPNEKEQGAASEYSTKEDPLKVIVTGFPPYSQPPDLTRIFSKFGNVKLEHLNTKFATFVYLSEDDARTALQASKKANVYGEFLTVRAYSEARHAELTARAANKRDFSRSKQKAIIIDPKQLDLSGDFHHQLERVLAGVRLTQEDVAALTTLYTDVETALQVHWPGCTAIPFGSITTGLGVKTSDADCFMHIPVQYRSPQGNFVNKAKRVLQQYPNVFTEILAIPRANTPIVKFFHIPTQTNCDLTFKTPLGAQNSKLIAFLLHSDPRLIPMAVVIKYWAKVHELSGTGKLTNYALTLLIIFYLQQPPLGLLPSVERLQRGAPALCVDHWLAGFTPHHPAEAPAAEAPAAEAAEAASVADLIGGFFEYYSMFNFEEMVVCTYLGAPVAKDAFLDWTRSPPEFHRYRANVAENLVVPMRCDTAVCVQDPIEQCHNVASAVSGRLAAEIRAYFKFAANAYEKEKPTCDRFLETILLQKPKIVRARSHPEYRVNLFPRIVVTIVDPDWKSVVRDLVFVVFEKMLNIKLGKVEEKVNMDTKKEKEKYMGVVTKAIWKRKQFSRLYSVIDLPFLEKQAKITDEILKVDKEVISIQFQLTVTFSNDPKSAVVAIKLGNGDLDAFRDFGKFFISVMQGWFLSLLRPYSRPAERDAGAPAADDADDDSTDDDDGYVHPTTTPTDQSRCVVPGAPSGPATGVGVVGVVGGVAGGLGGDAAAVY